MSNILTLGPKAIQQELQLDFLNHHYYPCSTVKYST